MTLTPLFNPEQSKRPMRVAAFMSGSGTNIIRLIEHEKSLEKEEGYSPFKVIFIFSDKADGSCQGEKIACENGIPYFSYDIRAFHQLRQLKRSVTTPKGLSSRREFDKVAKKLINAFEIDILALGGYMSFITLDRCVNVHPADLSILVQDKTRKYTGDNAVFDAISDGETVLRSSTLWTDQGVDTGPLLMVSAPLEVDLPAPLNVLLKDTNKLHKLSDEYQERLKEIGDWKIFPHTIEMISRGRFALDYNNRIFADGIPVPKGFRE